MVTTYQGHLGRYENLTEQQISRYEELYGKYGEYVSDLYTLGYDISEVLYLTDTLEEEKVLTRLLYFTDFRGDLAQLKHALHYHSDQVIERADYNSFLYQIPRANLIAKYLDMGVDIEFLRENHYLDALSTYLYQCVERNEDVYYT